LEDCSQDSETEREVGLPPHSAFSPEEILGDTHSLEKFLNLPEETNFEEIVRSLFLKPGGVLHKDSFLDDLLVFIKRFRSNREIFRDLNNWTKYYLPGTRKLLHSLSTPILEKATALLEQLRFHPNPVSAMLNFPYLVGAAALLRRAQAQGLTEAPLPNTGKLAGSRFWAQELFEHDLYAWEVILHTWKGK
jgi:hypothetical protein